MAANTRSKKRRRSASSSQIHRDPEATGEFCAKLTRADLLCPICYDLLNEVYSTRCGHSFCFQCISVVTVQSHLCPVCKSALPGPSSIYPNCYLNDVVTKFRTQATRNKEASQGSSRVADILGLATASQLSTGELQTLLRGIQQELQEHSEREEYIKRAVLNNFFDKAFERAQKDLETQKAKLAALHEDITHFKSSQPTTSDSQGDVLGPSLRSQGAEEDLGQVIPPRAAEQSSSQPPNSMEEEIQAVVPSASPSSSNSHSTLSLPTSSSDEGSELSAEVGKRNLRVDANFDEIMEGYFRMKLPCIGEKLSPEESLAQFSEGVYKFTRYQSFRELATLSYGDQATGCCIVSSLEFDKDGEFFAVAGVTKKIKIFDYQSVIKHVGFTNHFPVCHMSCDAKLSCVAYNPYHKHNLVSSDYEGCVCVWDTNLGKKINLHQEHGRRVWSVAYNTQEPTMFASGSDDCTVKLWASGKTNSIFSLTARANICSVKFNPHHRYLLAYGSADHGVHYIDLRNPSQPLLELMGHKKAVSYVNFMGLHELVSASTDSELKLWDTAQGVCRRTYRGHTNDKNFVGLTVTPDFMACGSENNAVYVYAKQVSSPMLTYQYNAPRGLLPSSDGEEGGQSNKPNEFVSALSWKSSKAYTLLAANSQGNIKVLEMC